MQRFKGLVFIFLLLLSTEAISVPYAVFNHKIFYVPERGPVIETYFDIYGKSITLLPLKGEDDAFQGEIEITVIFKQKEQIVTFDKKTLKSPVMSRGRIVDFIDLQRFALASGKYDVEIELKDLNAPTLSGITSASLSIDVPKIPDGTFFSDLELVSAYKKTEQPGALSKSGYDLLPMVSDSILKPTMKEVVIYTELYGTNKRFPEDEMFLVTAYLSNSTNQEPIESTRKYMRKSVGKVVPLITSIPIADVGDGQFDIVFEARTRDNELFARASQPIKRDKQVIEDVLSLMKREDLESTWVSRFESKAEIYDYIHSVRPIATIKERGMLDNSFREFESSDLKHMRSFMYAFWESRNPGLGETDWLAYKEKVDFVDEEFGTINKNGYETDRGRVYLQYGPPDDLTDRKAEPSSLPYQIWRYYKTGQFNNVRFVFYDPQVTDIEYVLLHSDGVRGEPMNPQWRFLLEQRNTPFENVDQTRGRKHFGGRVDDYFENPR